MLITNRSVPLESLSNVGAVRPYDMTDDKVVIASNATHRWRAYYWPYYLQQKPLVLEKGVGSLWLRDNLGMITLSFERRDRDPKASPPPRPPKCMVDALTAKRVLEGKPPVPNQQVGRAGGICTDACSCRRNSCGNWRVVWTGWRLS